ncbi:hypothetical protein U5922_010305 [Aquicoccus sp. G2-2]|uniref:hypothetical protein n=1 Tax=Aquicoccus sp. G2-2 TaxID=3092120 RepID=UPI002AE0A07A|nr:hypothetical protein [Aquicoccus sp. G2-2]MEA1113843.1 hypothetical protein [Aquicoccus sp. G2-2]
MRSITCINLASLLLAGLAMPVAAAPDTLPSGCYARSYSIAHLVAHPDQVVARMTLDFNYEPSLDIDGVAKGTPGVGVGVVLANQGHVARKSELREEFPNGMGWQAMETGLTCAVEGNAVRCDTGCGAGGFEVLQADDEAITIRTSGLEVGQGQACGGFTNITERPGVPVTFRLRRVTCGE